MRISYRWLSSVLGSDLGVERIAERLTMNGIEVEDIIDLGAIHGKIVVARILEIAPHPNADQLVLCRVDAGKPEPLRIVCGAKNMKAGDLVPLALEGAKLPGGFVLKRSKIRGEVSEGMMCSGRELGWSDDASGLLILPEDWIYRVGEPFDAILDLKIMPNRPDCLSLYGVARDLAAALGLPVPQPAETSFAESQLPAQHCAKVSVEAPRACPRYTGRVIKNVTIGPSPLWLQRAVESAGIRSINNVVDVTNYILVELGHPLHAFDLDKVTKGHVIVRYARDRERVQTLDGQEHELCAKDLLIADPEKPIALAGIMGCGNTEISESTRNVFLECAYFDPPTIRRTSKRLGKVTESSYRFERGTDWAALDKIVDRAAALITRVAGGEIAQGRFDEKSDLESPSPICLSISRANALSGLSLSTDEAAKPLKALGFEVVEGENTLEVTPPTFRPDVRREADLVEEITRIIGYDKVPSTLPRIQTRVRDLTHDELLSLIVREVATEFGLSEVMNYSFLSDVFIEKIGFDSSKVVRLSNPLSGEFNALRPHLVPGLLQTVLYNQNHGTPDVWVYEVGKVFFHAPSAETGFGEHYQFVAVLSGAGGKQRTWRTVPPRADFFEAKSLAEVLLERLGVENYSCTALEVSTFLHPGKSARLVLDGKLLVEVGELHPRIHALLEFKRPVAVVWADFPSLAPYVSSVPQYREIPQFPVVARDLALIADRDIPAAQVEEVIRKRAKSLLVSLNLFDVYEGERIPPGKKSLAYQMQFSAPDRTLTDEEVNQLITKIISDLKAKLGVDLRS